MLHRPGFSSMAYESKRRCNKRHSESCIIKQKGKSSNPFPSPLASHIHILSLSFIFHFFFSFLSLLLYITFHMTIKVFDTALETRTTIQKVTYDLSPPTHIESIKNAIVQRYGCRGSKRKLSYHPVIQRPLKKKATHDVNGGLPSPPVERALTPPPQPPSPSMRSHRAISTCPSSSSMTVSEITTKLDQLKQEKHRLFQLIKRLVQEEAEQQQEQLR